MEPTTRPTASSSSACPGEPSAAVTPLTDSPWFWAYLFVTGALVALVLAGPKYVQRQPQIERQFAARQSGGQAVVGADGPIPASTSDDMILSLRPLYVALAVLVTVAWIGLWRQRFGGGRQRTAARPRA